jgi:ribosomal protein L11 methyltransferase
LAAEPARRRWLVVTVQDPSAESLETVAEGFFSFGASAIETLPDGIRTWLPEDGAGDALAARVRALLAARGIPAASVGLELRGDADWAAEWRRGLGPRRVGERVVVTPSWVEPDRRVGDVVITIDPQMAFGTGEHASTRGVLRLMERLVKPGHIVLDVGTGSAVLAIAAVLLGAERAHGVEGDPDALINAAENVVRNGVIGRVTLEEAWVDDAYLTARQGAYDVIVANVLSGVLVPLLPALRHALRPAGAVVLAGILQEESADVVSAAAAAGYMLAAEDREEEWWSGHFACAPAS